MRKKKNIIIISMCLAVLLMIVGYAAFQTRLMISGMSNITGSWGIEITNIKVVDGAGSAYYLTEPEYSGTHAVIQTGLRKPGDRMVYGITVKNTGTINAIIQEVKINTEGSSAIVYSVSGLQSQTRLAKGASKTFNLTVSFDPAATSIPSDNTKIIDIDILAVQDESQSLTPSNPSIDQSMFLSTKILNDNPPLEDTNINFSQISSATNGQGLYYTSTNTQGGKKTYYFRGAVENNYVQFGTYKSAYSYENYVTGEVINVKEGDPIIWRIVRINEDGSIRLIKQDAIVKSNFNNSENDNAYVGYMYGTPGSATYALTHENKSNSTIKSTLDTWYTQHLSDYSLLFAGDAGFCNDRSVATTPNEWYSGDTALGYGSNITYYGASNRLFNLKQPQFKCPNEKKDLFTLSSSNKGNKMLSRPIGLLTVDEAVYAGGAPGVGNAGYYLNNDDQWFTMSPDSYDWGLASIWTVVDSGAVIQLSTVSFGIRPVINLKGDVTVLKGDGTSSNPYVIDTEPKKTLVSQILKDNNEQADINIDFSQISSSTNGQGLYYTSTNTENNGTTYYFRGAVTNNYVSFAGYTWRIVRINEDGSIRLITENVIPYSMFNDNPTDNAYVGYMYGTVGSTSYDSTHINTYDSTIKHSLDNWYDIYLRSYASLFAPNAGFCNDRSVAPSADIWDTYDTALGYGRNTTYYGSYHRIYNNNRPQFKCPNEANDLFTLNTSTKGNKKLTKPIGMLTLDEVIYAGGKVWEINGNCYLDNIDDWWTMSPKGFDGDGASVWGVFEVGRVDFVPVIFEIGVRPVINLKADVEITGGNGTSGSPYVIKTK